MVIASENLVGNSKLDLLKAYCCSSTVFWLSSFCPSASLLYYSCFLGSVAVRLAPFASAVLSGLSGLVPSIAQVNWWTIIATSLVSNSSSQAVPYSGVADVQTGQFWSLEGFVLLSIVNTQWWNSGLTGCLCGERMTENKLRVVTCSSPSVLTGCLCTHTAAFCPKSGSVRTLWNILAWCWVIPNSSHYLNLRVLTSLLFTFIQVSSCSQVGPSQWWVCAGSCTSEFTGSLVPPTIKLLFWNSQRLWYRNCVTSACRPASALKLLAIFLYCTFSQNVFW